MAGKRTSADLPSDPISSGDNGAPISEPIGNAGDSGTIDPATLDGNGDGFERDGDGNLVIGANGQPRKRRGRKPGSGSGSGSSGVAKPGTRNNQTVAAGIETLSQSLMFVHMGLAAFTDFKNWELKKEESDSLAKSVANVMEQFDMAPDPRFAAVAGLITTAGMIYGPRVYLYREHNAKKRAEKRANKPDTPANQSQFSPGDFDGYNLGG